MKNENENVVPYYMQKEIPVTVKAKFRMPGKALKSLLRAYSGGPLPLDPGPGSIVTSYRLPPDLVREKAALAGEPKPSVFLRRLMLSAGGAEAALQVPACDPVARPVGAPAVPRIAVPVRRDPTLTPAQRSESEFISKTYRGEW